MAHFQSPAETLAGRKRSVFSLGKVGVKTPSYIPGRKMKPPPSEGKSSKRRSLSLVASPSPMGGTSDKHKKSPSMSRSLFQRPTLISPTPSAVTIEGNTKNDLLQKDQLQAEVDSLRQQLKELGASTERSHLLLGQVKVLEEESQRKDEKLRHLNDRLHGIQRGLTQIDEERSSLQIQVKRLEEEKRSIQRELDIREQEVLSLVKRCSDQEEKMRESTLLRSRYGTIQKEIDELRNAMAQKEREGSELDEVKCELEYYKRQAERVKRDRDAMASTLNDCMIKIKALTNEKQEWEGERPRLLHRAEVDLEKQRLQYMDDINGLKVTLETRKDKIERLEEFMKDKSMANLMLRKENTELKKWKKHTSSKNENCEKEISDLRKENANKTRQIEDFKAVEAAYSSRIKAKEEEISALERDISHYMQRAMSSSESLQVLQEENEELEELAEELEAKLKSYDEWQQEKDALNDCLQVMQQQIQELMEDVVTAQLEKDEIEEDYKELLSTSINSNRTSDIITSLQEELKQKERNWNTQESRLHDQINTLQSKLFSQGNVEGIVDKIKSKSKSTMKEQGMDSELQRGPLQNQYDGKAKIKKSEDQVPTQMEADREEQKDNFSLEINSRISDIHGGTETETYDERKKDSAHVEMSLSQQKENNSLLRNELLDLRQKLRKAQTTIELKDDEIRELRIIELKDYEEEVQTLQDTILAKETVATSKIGHLQSKLQLFTLNQTEREKEYCKEINNYQRIVGDLKAKISNLKKKHGEKPKILGEHCGKENIRVEDTIMQKKT